MDSALDMLFDLLEKVLYGEIEHDEGVCLIFDQVYELIMKLKSIHNFKGQIDNDTLDVEIFCSVQDLVHGPPIVPCQIPLELQVLRARIMGIIRKVTGAPLSPPRLPPKCDGSEPFQWLVKLCEYFEFYEIPLADRLHRVTSMLEGSALSWFNWRMRGGLIDGWEDFVEKFKIRFAPLHALDYISLAKTSEKARDTVVHMKKDLVAFSDLTVEDIDASKGSSTSSPIKDSSARSHIKEGNYNGPSIVGDDGGALDDDYGYDVLASVEKVANADKKQVDNFISFDDTIKLFDLIDVVKTEHLVSPIGTTYAMRPVSFFHYFSARAKLVQDSKSGIPLWFSILSPVLKHEWEPPP
ncbi:unnamed protein product [Cuscuta campestris]|uniref:Retrotransposon gag domain-containing protein n=1 Tax=Cuscuta campestris TaxID=132261 RepID=A0A484M4E6_9ASTE|nr:unnamed protein product [Cuscuta campestris]